MKQLSHIVWNEGMHLAQHHFQAQSRFFEDTVQFALTNLFFKPYELAALELDHDALRNDTVSVVHARGIMPDGTAFDIPASDPGLNPISIRERFSPTSDNQLLLLGIPPYEPDHANFATNGNAAYGDAAQRYTAQSSIVRDEMTGRDERTLSVGRKNLRLLLDSDPGAESDGLVTMPIARVRRDGTGHFAYDSDYIAPSLHIGASPRLLSMLHRVLEILESKGDSIARGRRGSSDEFAQREVASFWLLHTINASIPTLRDYLQSKRVHPERLYTELARLGGALCTFSLDAHPRSLPAYDHDRPELSFDALDRHIRAHLDVVAPTGRSAIPFSQTAPFLYTATVTDPRSFGPSRWILGIRSTLAPGDIATRFPQLAKVCSNRFVMELVRRAFPGLTLDHLPYPPASISPQGDMVYFAVQRAGPCWDTIVQTHEVGVYVPEAIPVGAMELSVIIDGAG
jgi:type VI secretion system protein ImpJ